MYLVNTVIGVASIVAFHALLRLLFPNRARIEYALATALYALAPLFVANAVFLTLDYAAAAFFVLFVYFMFAGRPWTAGAFIAFLAFTKETGGAGALTVLAFIVGIVLKKPGPRAVRIAALRSQWPLVAVPAAALVVFPILSRLRPDFGTDCSTCPRTAAGAGRARVARRRTLLLRRVRECGQPRARRAAGQLRTRRHAPIRARRLHIGPPHVPLSLCVELVPPGVSVEDLLLEPRLALERRGDGIA